MNPSTVATHPYEPGCGPVFGNVFVSAVSLPFVEDPLAFRNRATWSAGDFDKIARGFARGAAAFVDRIGVSAGDIVLDAASGTGNLAIPAARRGAVVSGLDIAPNLVATAKEHASAYRLNIAFHEGNVEAMPYADRTFTTVLSMFGVMFAPRPERVTAELMRVTRPGGRIALANWQPEGFVGQMLRAHAARVPAPAGVPSPLLWGSQSVVHERFEPYAWRIRAIHVTPRTIAMEHPTDPAGVVTLFRDYYGPSVRAFAALNESDGKALFNELVGLWTSRNVGAPGTTRVDAEYLEVIVELR